MSDQKKLYRAMRSGDGMGFIEYTVLKELPASWIITIDGPDHGYRVTKKGMDGSRLFETREAAVGDFLKRAEDAVARLRRALEAEEGRYARIRASVEVWAAQQSAQEIAGN